MHGTLKKKLRLRAEFFLVKKFYTDASKPLLFRRIVLTFRKLTLTNDLWQRVTNEIALPPKNA